MKSAPDYSDLHVSLANEIAAIANRTISARSANTSSRLEAVKRALQAATASIDTALTAAPPGDEGRPLQEQLSAHPAFDAIRAALAQRDAANEELTTALQQAQGELDQVRTELQAQRERGGAQPAEIARLTAEFENTLDELRREHVATVGEQAMASASLPLDALLTIFNAMRRARSSAEVMSHLVDGLAREFPRVALFDVRETHLEGRHQVGFDFSSDMSKVVIPLTTDSLLSRSIISGRLEAFFSGVHGEAASTLPFNGTPSCAVAIPITIQQTTTAVIYADDTDKPEFATAVPQTRAKFAELLYQHAVVVLYRVTMDEKALIELREFARLLTDEIEYAHTADIDAGINAIERQQALKENIGRSRRLYAQRAEETPGGSVLLEQQLTAIVEARTNSSFGRDLASALGATPGPTRASVLTMHR